MKDKTKQETVEIQQVGYTYIFDMSYMMRAEEREKIDKSLRDGLERGCVLLPKGVTLVDVKPRLAAVVKAW